MDSKRCGKGAIGYNYDTKLGKESEGDEIHWVGI
jgi:hypothetical protein